MTPDEPRWDMWARLTECPTGPCYLNVSTHRRYTDAYCFDGERPVEVTVYEDPDGPYFGWMDSKGTEPVMIQPHPGLYSMQFTYGPEAEESAGKGRTIRLRVEARPLTTT